MILDALGNALRLVRGVKATKLRLNVRAERGTVLSFELTQVNDATLDVLNFVGVHAHLCFALSLCVLRELLCGALSIGDELSALLLCITSRLVTGLFAFTDVASNRLEPSATSRST